MEGCRRDVEEAVHQLLDTAREQKRSKLENAAWLAQWGQVFRLETLQNLMGPESRGNTTVAVRYSVTGELGCEPYIHQ